MSSDLINDVPGDALDVFIVSNGGSAEASERIVRLLRSRFKSVRFLVASNAYSAATLMCFSADEVVMTPLGTLGPIDPQINGVPARAILRAFENLEARLKTEGPRALTAYMPLISKYDLHILEICKSTQELSEELARTWLSTYMLKCEPTAEPVAKIINFFKSYDVHKSHGRSIDMVPLDGGGGDSAVVPEGVAIAPGEEPQTTYFAGTPHVLKTLNVPIAAGRDFTDADGAGKTPVAIVNGVLARRLVAEAGRCRRSAIPAVERQRQSVAHRRRRRARLPVVHGEERQTVPVRVHVVCAWSGAEHRSDDSCGRRITRRHCGRGASGDSQGRSNAAHLQRSDRRRRAAQ